MAIEAAKEPATGDNLALCTARIRITDGVPEIVEYVNHVKGKTDAV